MVSSGVATLAWRWVHREVRGLPPSPEQASGRLIEPTPLSDGS